MGKPKKPHHAPVAVWDEPDELAEDEFAVILSPDDVIDISKSLGKNIQSAEDLKERCAQVTTLRVDGVEVTLEPRLLMRLKSRCIHRDFKDFLKEVVVKQLHDYAGY